MTKQEIEILKLFAEGLFNRVPGERFFISPGTADTQHNNIMEKQEIKKLRNLFDM